MSRLWYQYLQNLDRTTETVVNTVTQSVTLLSRNIALGAQSADVIGEQGPRGFPGRNGRDGVTRVVHIYSPSDEGEHSHVQRRG